MKLERTIRAAQPIELVFGYLADFTTTTHWDPGTVLTTLVSGDGGVGTVYANRSRFMGRENDLTYVVEELAPFHRIALRGSNGTVVAHDSLELAAEGAGTVVTYRVTFEFNGLARFLGPLLALPMKKLGDEGAAGMGAALSRL